MVTDSRVFEDKMGNRYEVASIVSMSRNSVANMVSMVESDGTHLTVEVTPTTAINIIEYCD